MSFLNKHVVINFINDADMLVLGGNYKNKTYATDVLTFILNEDSLKGEIYINIDQAKRQSIEHNVTYEEEIAELIKHGMLHMQGIHHEGDE